jgi:aminopeptidase N
MWLDSLKNSHSIKVKVNSVDELSELFDEIAYEKGGSILRMIERYVGDEQFKKGLRNYIKEFQYKNSEAHDLWLSLENAGKQKVVKMVEGFITQVGFPYVQVSTNKNNIDLCQKRFLFEQEDNTRWELPFVNKVSDKDKTLLSINADYGAFFISDYDVSLLEKIGVHILELNNKEKIGLIHDLYFLSKFQKKPLNTFISFITEHFISEKDSAVLFYLLDILGEIQLLLEDITIEKLLRLYATKGLDIVGMEPKKEESTYDTFLRSTALSTLSELDDSKIVSFLNTKFAEYLKNQENLHPDLKMATLSNAVWSNDKNYELVLECYRKSSSQEEQVKLLQALTHSKNEKTIKKALDFCLSPEVRFSNLYAGVIAASKNSYGKKIAFDWLLDNWKELGKRVGGIGGTMLRREVQAILPIAGIGQEQKVKEFIKRKEISGLDKTFKQAWEELQINAAFVKSNKK